MVAVKKMSAASVVDGLCAKVRAAVDGYKKDGDSVALWSKVRDCRSYFDAAQKMDPDVFRVGSLSGCCAKVYEILSEPFASIGTCASGYCSRLDGALSLLCHNVDALTKVAVNPFKA